MRAVAVLAKTMRDYRVPALAVALVAVVIGFMDVAIYPSYRESLQDFDLPGVFETMVGEADGITSPEGFLAAEFFAWVPLLFITIAIIGATGTTAGEEAAGTLDLLLAQPVSRRRVLAEKAGGLAALLALGVACAWPGLLAGKLVADFPIGPGRLLLAVLSIIPLVLLFEALALWAGAWLGSRTGAAMVATGVVVATYFLHLIGGTAPALDDVRKASPFYWADSSVVLVEGFQWLRTGALLAVAAALFVLAWWSFERRDIGVAREWRLRPGLPWRMRAAPGEEQGAPEQAASQRG